MTVVNIPDNRKHHVPRIIYIVAGACTRENQHHLQMKRGQSDFSIVCKHLAKRISWVRRRDWHILTSGMFTYTNDERFQVLHAEGSDDWTLQIKYVQKRDNGTYECQDLIDYNGR
ncbi:hypothetical protein B566_EDAN006069 [Ephemera danica]|nr:hypothetical protein B566_EDAN006069 [Ephemera danica]